MRKSAKKVQEELKRRGVSISELARDMGVSRTVLVYVLNGGACRRGQAHDIAVRLGIKNGVPRASGQPLFPREAVPSN